MGITLPGSTRLLRNTYTHRPKTETSDGDGGLVDTFADGAKIKGTKRAVYTEQYTDVVGERIADRGLYIVWVKQSDSVRIEDQIRDESDGMTLEVKRTDKQNGLSRLVLVEQCL